MIVIKIGGSIVEGLNPSILDDFSDLVKKQKFVIVHGGGKDVTNIANSMGKEQKFLMSPDGKRSRYTDKETAMIYTMVMSGKISKNITGMLQSKGISSVGITGIDGEMIKADRKKKLMILNEKGRKMLIEGGYTGKVSTVNPKLINCLLDNDYVPIISPIAISNEFEFLNIDGDRAAANVAGALQSDVVIFITNVNGLLMDDHLIPRLSLEEARNMLPQIGPGMEKKVLACTEALSMGVKKVYNSLWFSTKSYNVCS